MSWDTSSVAGLARDWGAVPVELRARLRPALLQAGQLIASKARATAAGFSERIPGAISVSTRFSSRGGVMVRVNSTKAPHARALEGTTRNNTFRHPVFDRDVWVDQPTQPFLFPAVRARRDQAKSVIALAVRQATRVRAA